MMQPVSVSCQLQDQGHRRNKFFVDDDGHPIKFRIQPGFNSTLRKHLVDGIISNGGLIIPKIPMKGVVIVDPKSRTGRKIVSEWSWTERPARYFVSYAFVLRCVNEKQLHSLEEHALVPNASRYGRPNIQTKLSEDAKEKLALYLAKIMPHPSSGNRSSNKIYQRLVKNRDRFPWIGDYAWQMFRNQYCKNKRFYDKLIMAIVKNDKGKAISVPSSRHPPVVKKEPKTNVELDIPVRNRHLPKIAVVESKNLESTFVFERKRKLADDISNLKRKTKAVKTIDDMLRAPLPPIVIEQKKGRPRRLPTKTFQKLITHDIDDVEVGRGKAKTRNILADVWVNDSFRDDGWNAPYAIDKTPFPQANNNKKATGSRTLDLYQHSLTSYGMDLDDFCSAAFLDSSNVNDKGEDMVEEQCVVKLLGLLTEPTELTTLITEPARKRDLAESTDSLASADPKTQHDEENRVLAIQDLARKTRFIPEEVQQKLAGFLGDMNKTCDFFLRCRQLVDNLFAQYVNVDAGSVSITVQKRDNNTTQLAAALSDVELFQQSFPAMNTRARAAVRG